MSASRWLLCIALIAVGLSATAQTTTPWKWRDKAGQVHISDLPPPRDVADKDVLQRPTSAQRRTAAAAAVAAVPASAASAPRVEPELEAKRRKADEEKAAKAKAEEEKIAATRADNCTRARGYARQLDDGMRIARTNDKGEREYLDDKQRAAEAQRAREVIASDCK